MADLVPLLNNINWFDIVGQATYWFGIIFVGIFMAMVIFAVYHIFSFKYKVTVYPLVGSGTTHGLSVGKKKWNKFRWNKRKNAWLSLFPLFNKREIEPFDDKFIYSGNHIVAFKIGEKYLPGCINISNTESKTVQAELNPVPHSIRQWQALEIQKNEIEFAKHSWWEDNKYFFMTVITAGLCLVMVGLTVYFTYEFAAGGTSAMGDLSSALRTFGGVTPPG